MNSLSFESEETHGIHCIELLYLKRIILFYNFYKYLYILFRNVRDVLRWHDVTEMIEKDAIQLI